MKTHKEALKLALEALEYIEHNYMSLPAPAEKAITALREALAEQPAQQCRTDGRCQYAIDSGAEGMGHCPKGKCVMPAQQEPVYFCDYGYEGWGKVDADMAAANIADGMAVEAYYTSPQPAPVQQEPINPFAWANTDDLCADTAFRWCEIGNHKTPLYTSPPAQRTWVGLRDDEIYSVLENLQVMHHRPPTTDSRVIFARAIEAKLKEKNT